MNAIKKYIHRTKVVNLNKCTRCWDMNVSFKELVDHNKTCKFIKGVGGNELNKFALYMIHPTVKTDYCIITYQEGFYYFGNTPFENVNNTRNVIEVNTIEIIKEILKKKIGDFNFIIL